MVQRKNSTDVVQAIEPAEMAGRTMTDMEVAAVAAGQFMATELAVPLGVAQDSVAAEAVAMEAGGLLEINVEGGNFEENDERESDEASSMDEEGPVVCSSVLIEDEMEQEEEGEAAERGWGEWAGEEESHEESPSDSDKPEPQRRNKHAHLPTSGPLSICPSGDISDGEDGDLIPGGVPMTKNEGMEPILPLGEVSLDGAEVMPVGTILSLVEPDGIIVVVGTAGKPPLDEGSVLSAVAQDTYSKEPLGRIHEIFGPCAIPHYTVRVEGAATQHQLIIRYQTAKHKLLAQEKERAEAVKLQAKRTEDTAEQGDTTTAVEQEPAAPPVDRPGLTMVERREAAQKGAYKKKPNLNAEEKLAALRQTVKEAEEAMGIQKEHPFRRWKVGDTVYVLKNHAKFLAKELLVPRGKGSDASNMHDEEETEEEEFSDDEKERLARIRREKERKRDKLAEQGVLPHEIDNILAEAEVKRLENIAQRKATKAAAAAKRAAHGRGQVKQGRGSPGAETEGRGERGSGNRVGSHEPHGPDELYVYHEGGRGRGLRGIGDGNLCGRLGPGGSPWGGAPPGQPDSRVCPPGNMGALGSMSAGGSPMWGPPRVQPPRSRMSPPGVMSALGIMPNGMMPMPHHQQERGPFPEHNNYLPQHPGAVNSFVLQWGPRHGPQMAMMQGVGFRPRFAGPPPLSASPTRQGILNPGQFVQQQQQLHAGYPRGQRGHFQSSQQQASHPQFKRHSEPLRFQQPLVGYGAQPVNPVILPPPRGALGLVDSGDRLVRSPGLADVQQPVSKVMTPVGCTKGSGLPPTPKP